MNDPGSVQPATTMSGLARSGEIERPAVHVDAGVGHQDLVTGFGA